jgi:hypothetical protein
MSAAPDLGNRSSRQLLQCLPHAGIPQRETAAVRPGEDPFIGLRIIRGSLHSVTVNHVPQREWPFTGLRLRIIDVATPVALHDVDNAILQIDVGHFSPEVLKYERS